MKISLQRRHAPMVGDGAFSHKIDYITIFFGDFKSQRTPKLHYWFKSYSDFAEWVYFPIGQSGEASWWRVCYQRGLPHIV